jgi:hypothetical protein
VIDNNTQWTLWCIGWTLITIAAYRYGGEVAGLAALGAGFLRASGVPGDSPFSTLVGAILSFVKVKP